MSFETRSIIEAQSSNVNFTCMYNPIGETQLVNRFYLDRFTFDNL